MADTPSYFTPEELQRWQFGLTQANLNNILCHCRQCDATWVASHWRQWLWQYPSRIYSLLAIPRRLITLMDWLLHPLNYEFMRQALWASLLVGILCPIVGTYLIVQRMAMLGDVVAHGVLPGLAIASFFNLPILLGAFTFGLSSTFVIAWIRTQSRIKVDTAMAITFSTFFSLGITLLTIFRSRVPLEQLLFGDILSIRTTDVQQIAVITGLVLVGVALFYKELLFFTFDPLGAEALGLPVTAINFGLMAAITLAIIAGMKTVGVILVVALMVGPAATAYLLVKELHWMMILGACLGVLFGAIGMYSSYYLDIPSGPAIGLTVFTGFLLSLLFSPRQGILTRYIYQR